MFHQLIDKLNEKEAIVWNASEEFFNKIWINFYNEDVITDYLPAARCPSYNPVIKLFNYSEYFELWEYINNQLKLKSVILKRKNNKIEVYSVFSEILKIFCFDDKREVVETLTKEMNEVWKIDDCVCRPTKLHVFSSKFTYLHFLLKSKLCLIKQINDVKIDNHEWFSEGMEMLRCLIEKIPKTQFALDFNYTEMFSISKKEEGNKGEEFIYSEDIITMAFSGKIWSFKLINNKSPLENIHFYGKEFIKSKDKNIFALKILDMSNKFMRQIENYSIALIDKNFQKKLTELTQSNDEVYIIFNSNDLTWIIDIEEFKINKKYLKYWSKVNIKIDWNLKIESVIKKISCFPKTTYYTFQVNDTKYNFDLLKSIDFIDKSKNLNWKIIYNGVEIQIKKIKNEDEHKYLKEKIIEEIQKRELKQKIACE